ncbi:zf-HC2 domain-containing protein [Actinophytocola sediminis]
MECANCREALSARIDGEDEPVPATSTDEHLRDCADCQQWYDRAIDLSRSLRVRAAAPVPDLSQAILDDAPVLVDTRGWSPRLALGGVGVAQISLALSQLFGVGATAAHARHDAVPVASHLFNEGTAWNLALGIGLFWAAFRPRATSGLIPVLGGFVLVLLAYSTHDLVTGTAPVTRVAGHGLLVAGLLLLILVNRRPDGSRPADTGDDRVDDHQPPAEPPADPKLGSRRPGRPPLRPAGRHRAA